MMNSACISSIQFFRARNTSYPFSYTFFRVTNTFFRLSDGTCRLSDAFFRFSFTFFRLTNTCCRHSNSFLRLTNEKIRPTSCILPAEKCIRTTIYSICRLSECIRKRILPISKTAQNPCCSSGCTRNAAFQITCARLNQLTASIYIL